MDGIDGTYLKSLFDPYFVAPLKLWEDFASHMYRQEFKKNEILKAEDTVEKYMHVILEGSVGVFMWSDNNQRCLDLFFDHDFCTDYMSFLNQERTPLFTQTLEATQVITIKRKDVIDLYYDSILGLQIVRSAAESLFLHKQKQQINMLTMTAEERYKRMMQETPEIIHRTPAKHLASYLGIAPESMSRIRKKYQG